VTAIFASLLFLTVIELGLNAPRYLRSLLAAGSVALALSLPFLRDMRASADQAGPSIFEFAARPFQPVILIFQHFHVTSPLMWNFTYLSTLPLNYLFEFGAFFVAGIWWIYDRRSRRVKLSLPEHLAIGLLATSLILPALIWSGTEYSNDFGYRGVLPAQFILLLWATEMFYPAGPENRGRGARRLLQVAAALTFLGVGTTMLNAFLIRATIGNFEKGTVLPGQMLRASYSPALLADLREAYVWVQKNTPRDALIQENPATWQLIAQGQYSQRPTVVYGSNPSFIMLGKERTDYYSTLDAVRRLFEFRVSNLDLADTCSANRIDYLVVQDSDPIWADRNNYVWTQIPVFASPRVRIMRCRE
jgi:hypothetical protein